jgi:deazaflavin-dependent oxidoreductase (nitroreductase family)
MKAFFRLVYSIATALYRLTGGRIGGKVQGLPVLLLTTTGRKTGKSRVTPVGYFEADGGYVVVASNAGFDNHPGWYHNLKHSPRVTFEIRGNRAAALAETAGPDLRARLWARLMELAPGYGAYQKRTSREIPIVLLHSEAKA